MAGREVLVSLATAGEVGVGKTSLLHRLLERKEDLSTLQSTVGVEISPLRLPLQAGGVARVQLFDTAGQEQYRESISKVYLRGRDVYTLVYDVGRLDTAADLERHWLPLLASLVKPGCAVLLLGNKLDALSDAEQESPALCSAQQSLVQAAKALLPHCSVAHSHVSALTGAGMDAVTSQLEAISTELLCRQEAAAEETVVEPEPVQLSERASLGAPNLQFSSKMRLITHNMMFCNVKACVATANMESEEPKNFPLHITIAEGGIKQVPQEFSAEFVVGILPRIDWRALRATAAELGIAALPEALPESYATDVGFLKSVHTLILEVHVTEGALVCGNCQRVYPIVKGIPNMLLNEDEV